MNMIRLTRSARRLSALVALLAGAVSVVAVAAPEPAVKKGSPVSVTKKAAPEPAVKKGSPVSVTKKGVPVTVVSATAAPPIYLVPLGESKVYRFEQPIRRVAVGNPAVADYIMLNNSEMYLLGKKLGSTNLSIWDQKGKLTSTPLQVSRGTASLQALLKMLLPKENDIHILALGPALVLSGSVSDQLVSESVSRLVTAYLGGSVPKDTPESALIDKDSTPLAGILSSNNGVTMTVSTSRGGTRGDVAGGGSAGADSTRGVVNLLKIRDPQQVRLEVCIAQVSRTYLESFGVSFLRNSGNVQGGTLLTGFVSNATLNNVLRLHPGNGISIQGVADRNPSLFRVLAEPTIVTMSGKEGYFLVGGKIYTPTVTNNGAVDYVERTYGVGLRFTPVVLDSGRISLKVVPEFSYPDNKPITAGTTINLPSFKISTVSSTVQMNEGENLVIGGLMLDNLTNSMDQVPLLGEIPILGALFRDAQKNQEKTELMVIVRPTLVKASTTMPERPTDRAVPPTPGEFFLNGKLEGSRKK